MKKEGRLLMPIILIVFVASCATANKERRLSTEMPGASISIAKTNGWREKFVNNEAHSTEDEPEVEITDLQGNKVILMRAVQDEISGEMIAVDELEVATVQARFRNIPERNGEVEVAFDIIIPQLMQDPSWQIRFSPLLYIQEDTLALDKLMITGDEYRQRQLRGYELYNKYLSTIIPDSVNFIDYYTYRKQLDIFISRNLPKFASLRNDTTLFQNSAIEDEVKEAVSHYTKQWLVKANRRRKNQASRMYQRYVKTPIIREGVKLDSIITSADSTITYCYVQRLPVRPHLRKIELILRGSVYESDREIYVMNQSDPLTFYVSSISTLADDTPKFIKKVIERNKEDNLVSELDFSAGKYLFEPQISNNDFEISLIKEKIKNIIENNNYIIDSLVITASCSPEGTYKTNTSLAMKRGHSIMKYLTDYLEEYRKGLVEEKELESMDVVYENGAFDDDTLHKNRLERIEQAALLLKQSLISNYIPEDWDHFEKLIIEDSTLNDRQKREILSLLKVKEPDKRELLLKQSPMYSYISKEIYPRLRNVRFDFYTHIKGMVKDTIHTNELDTLYMRGVMAIRERDYRKAIDILGNYNDYNTAVVYTSLNLNYSALQILEGLPHSPKCDYLKAVAQSRLGEEQKAVQSLINAIKQDYSMLHRGNLDPEISELMYKFKIAEIVEQQ